MPAVVGELCPRGIHVLTEELVRVHVGGYTSCRGCARDSAKRQRDRDPDYRRRQHLRDDYNISLEQYNEMWRAQGGRCAVCGQPETMPGRNLAVDHDHGCCPTQRKCCGKCVRGLLCANCNNGLGRFHDDVELLARAIAYLAAPH